MCCRDFVGPFLEGPLSRPLSRPPELARAARSRLVLPSGVIFRNPGADLGLPRRRCRLHLNARRVRGLVHTLDARVYCSCSRAARPQLQTDLDDGSQVAYFLEQFDQTTDTNFKTVQPGNIRDAPVCRSMVVPYGGSVFAQLARLVLQAAEERLELDYGILYCALLLLPA
ncbi:hypothetical protein B484DRAFT_406560 [Ochromonadaceae sp. CCMP2298]|nr:hypothetical protein B484DRAFT_406560 [Ochromonadaceae sp. CCMP2298]